MSVLPPSLLPIFQALNPPDLGPTPRAARLPLPELNRLIEEHLQIATHPPETEPQLRAAALLWHDHLNESHAISQNLPGPSGSFLHGIMHRREPDYTNAKYWFHRVGQHQAFPDISRSALPLLTNRGANQLAVRLLPNGLWDPFAFIDACAEATPNHNHPDRDILVQIQRVEFESLVQHLLA
jgi:hypothetical protein